MAFPVHLKGKGVLIVIIDRNFSHGMIIIPISNLISILRCHGYVYTVTPLIKATAGYCTAVFRLTGSNYLIGIFFYRQRKFQRFLFQISHIFPWNFYCNIITPRFNPTTIRQAFQNDTLFSHINIVHICALDFCLRINRSVIIIIFIARFINILVLQQVSLIHCNSHGNTGQRINNFIRIREIPDIIKINPYAVIIRSSRIIFLERYLFNHNRNLNRICFRAYPSSICIAGDGTSHGIPQKCKLCSIGSRCLNVRMQGCRCLHRLHGIGVDSANSHQSASFCLIGNGQLLHPPYLKLS